MSKAQRLRVKGNLLQLMCTTNNSRMRAVYKGQYTNMSWREDKKAIAAPTPQ